MLASRVLIRWNLPEFDLLDAIEKLKTAYKDPRHYGDNVPNRTFDGVEVLPDPRFTFLDLYSFGTTGEGGFNEFRNLVGFKDSLNENTIIALIVLLLVDSSVAYLDEGDYLLAGADGMEAEDAMAYVLDAAGYDSRLATLRKTFARSGGLAAHRETEEFRRAILEKWQTGEFAGNKSEAARWARKQFPIKSDEVVRRWIREFEKSTTTTRQVP
jgi:hypothetical protein